MAKAQDVSQETTEQHTGQLLLVDDELGLREAVQAYLAEIGFSVRVASNATEGWEMLQHMTPDLVISDIMMPQVDGYEFLRWMRDDERFETLPVIFLTARGMTSDRIQGYDAGCDAYLPKPFDPDELVSIVSSILKRQAAAKVTSSGSAIDLEKMARDIEMIKRILSGGGGLPQSQPTPNIDFTPRERSVLELVAQGLMNKEIARQLETSVRNVEKYVSRLFNKTDTNSRTELVRYALEHGLTK
ncbi:MAG: response regulator transcription factor [Cyanothece sp. SIO2G6]|nr:response regulator transcription factor [Cyanothece sp. SIO2G6]